MPEPTSSTLGELAELSQLFETHRDRLLAMLERRIDARLRQRIGADAVLQDTYFRAASRWAAYQRGSPMKPYPWLYCLARECLFDAYKAHATKKRGLEQEGPQINDDCSAMLGQQIQPGTGPMTAAQRAELADRVHAVLASLPPEVARIIELRYFDQLTTREICDVVNHDTQAANPVSEDTMNVRLFRALEKMEKAWKARYGVPGSLP